MEAEIKVEGLKELMDELDLLCSPRIQQKLVKTAVKEGAKVVKADAERRIGKGKGYIVTGTPLKRFWSAATVASIGLGVAKKHWQMIFQEYGTSRHKVVAGSAKGSTAKALHFWWGPREVFFKSVDIPAIPAKPFLRPALDNKKNEVLERMKKYLELVLSALVEHKQKTIPETPEVD